MLQRNQGIEFPATGSTRFLAGPVIDKGMSKPKPCARENDECPRRRVLAASLICAAFTHFATPQFLICQSVEMVPRLAEPVTIEPFINQIRRWPVAVFCQRMSGFPSPLKSPVLAICQAVAMTPRLADPVRVAPFINQIRRWPVTVFCQRMSGLPSPLKSPVPAICQAVEMAPRLADPVRVAPFINQIRRWP